MKKTKRNTQVQSLPNLPDHLQQSCLDVVREGVARAVAVPGAKFAWPVLVKLYEEEPASRTKQGLAMMLANVADDELLDDLMSLARDARHGESRVLLLSALERSQHPRARTALMELGSDPELTKEIQRIFS